MESGAPVDDKPITPVLTPSAPFGAGVPRPRPQGSEMTEEANGPAPPKAKKGLPKTAIVIGAITLVQAAGFFVAMKYFGSTPAPTYGASEASGHGDETDDADGGGHGEATGGHATPPQDGGHGEAKKPDAHGAKPESGHGGGGGHGGKNYVDTSATAVPEPEFAEVVVLAKFRAPNHKGGRTYVYDFEVRAIVAAARKDDMDRLVKERAGEIADRVAQTIRAADERILREDDLQTLRMQLRNVLTQIAGDEKLIRRVLIPKFVPMRAD